MKVKDVMTVSPLIYCSPDTKLYNAAKVMKLSNCRVLPVVDNEKKVLGIITDRDICLSLAKKTAKPFSKNTVGQIMTAKVYTVKNNDHISAVFREMRKNQISRLPVVNGQGKLKGIVSLHNLINKSIYDGNEGLENFSSRGENLFRTIQAVTNRFNGNLSAKPKKVLSSKK
jgi:CBS domain-containing protein